jgi:hypothetical protein
MLLPTHKSWMTGTLIYSSEFWTHNAVGLHPWDLVGEES